MGGDYNRWDLEVREGIFAAACTLIAIEEHAAGKQLALTIKVKSITLIVKADEGGSMSITVWLAAKTLDYPQGGGHMWVYLNWALGLRALGCQVVWLEAVDPQMSVHEVQALTLALKDRLKQQGLVECLALCSRNGKPLPRAVTERCLDIEAATEAHLLLNLAYHIPPQVVERFQRSALIDIDPGLLQLWMSWGQLSVARHDMYFTIGETVGKPIARFPHCDLPWHYTPPAVFLSAWPPTSADSTAPYTTVSTWWGGEWLVFPGGEIFDNNKRKSFLDYSNLPSQTSARLELALCLGPGDNEERQFLEQRGWKIRHAWKVSSTPEQYRAYIQRSRGEFSCAKPAFMRLQNAWISDRTLCYLASGKPAVVQHTGPSGFLPDAAGLFRFRSLEEAACALDAVEADYEHQCCLARKLAEEYFDARKVVGSVLERALA